MPIHVWGFVRTIFTMMKGVTTMPKLIKQTKAELGLTSTGI